MHCRNGIQQPGVDTDLNTGGIQEPFGQSAGTSVGVTAVCYAESQPDEGGPKKPATIIGQDLNVWNSIAGQPFLSTGGFTHVLLGAVPHVDTDGPKGDANDCDGDGNTAEIALCLVSPCIPEFTPGTNLKFNLALAALSTGTIRVVADTVHDNIEGNADDCDDPAATDVFSFSVYDSPGGVVDADDDTDRDGCTDERELRSVLNQGGQRDPWNPYDWYDINHDGAVSVTLDVLQVSLANGAGNPNYAPRKDRGVLNYGPFGWNKSGPNGSIDVTSDVLGAQQQVSQPCLGHDPDTSTPTHELYDTGPAWPAGNGPWYGLGVVPNH